MKFFKLLSLSLFLCFTASAQSFYVSTPRNIANVTLGSYVYRVTVTPGGLVSQQITTCMPSDQFFSIAMDQSGFYWLSGASIYKGDIVGNTLTNCKLLTTIPINSAGLTIGPDHKLYYSSTSLYNTDIATGQTTFMGFTPYPPSGDFSFFDGKLYVTSVGLDVIDLTNPATASYKYMDLTGLNSVFGLVSVATSLHSNTMYAFSVNSTAHTTSVVELDMLNKTIKGVVGVLPYQVLDAASEVENGSILGIKVNDVKVHQDCANLSKGVIEVITNPHLETFTYTLKLGATTYTNTTGVFSGLSAGDYQLTITSASDSYTHPQPISVPVYAKPAFNYTVTNVSCAVKGSVKFTLNGDISPYQVLFNGTLYPYDKLFDNLATGTYHFGIENQEGCLMDSYDVMVGYDPCPIVITGLDIKPECDTYGKGTIAVTVDPKPNITYTYNLNGIVNNTGSFGMLSPGSYDLTVTSSDNGTPQKRTVIVPDFTLNKVAAAIEKNDQICELPGKIKLTIPPGSSGVYTIDYNSLNYPSGYTFTGLAEGTYTFTIRDSKGCIADMIDVKLLREECFPVSFPSAFTPNNDDINDLFRANPLSRATNFKLQIFDRRGSLVYSSTDLHQGWDGNYQGKAAPAGTYYYVSSFIDQESHPKTMSGYAVLIR